MSLQRAGLGIGLVILGIALLVISYWGDSVLGIVLGVGAVVGLAAGVVLVGTNGEAGGAGGGMGA